MTILIKNEMMLKFAKSGLDLISISRVRNYWNECFMLHSNNEIALITEINDFHTTHYRPFQGHFTGQMTQPSLSKHRRKPIDFLKLDFILPRPKCVTINRHDVTASRHKKVSHVTEHLRWHIRRYIMQVHLVKLLTAMCSVQLSVYRVSILDTVGQFWWHRGRGV